MKNLKKQSLASLLLLMSVFFFSCEKDDPVPELDQEVITEITLVFEELNDDGAPVPGSGFEVVARDAEGISLGGSPQVEDINSLEPGKSYQMTIRLYNDIADEDMTGEIEEHGEEHQFYFLGSALVGEAAFLDYTYDDEDVNGNPIGLKGRVSVNESVETTTGSLRVILRHGLNKGFGGADQPVFEHYETAGGESDLDITFRVNLPG